MMTIMLMMINMASTGEAFVDTGVLEQVVESGDDDDVGADAGDDHGFDDMGAD